MKNVRTQTRRILSVLLAVVMLAMSVPWVFADNAVYQAGDQIQFGSYPQSEVLDETLISRLNSRADHWVSYNYYACDLPVGYSTSDGGNMFASDFMQYCDVEYNGAKYRGVKFSQFRPVNTSRNSHTYPQEYNGYTVGTTYWFLYEPLKWKVLDASAGMLMSTTVIDSQPFNQYWEKGKVEIGVDTWDGTAIYETVYWSNPSKSGYADDYETSSLRIWLNETFYSTAFSQKQQEIMLPQNNDMVSILSYSEASSSVYGFNTDPFSSDSARCISGSEYAHCQGLSGLKNLPVNWWLGLPRYYDTKVYMVYPDGAYMGCDVDSTSVGVCPIIRIDMERIEEYESEVHVHSFIPTVTTPSTCTTKGVMTYTCACGNSYTEDIAVDPNAHGTLNENGDCPRCGKHVKDVEKPTEKPTEKPDNKPADEQPPENLNFFQRIIQWFRNLFAKLFGR